MRQRNGLGVAERNAVGRTHHNRQVTALTAGAKSGGTTIVPLGVGVTRFVAPGAQPVAAGAVCRPTGVGWLLHVNRTNTILYRFTCVWIHDRRCAEPRTSSSFYELIIRFWRMAVCARRSARTDRGARGHEPTVAYHRVCVRLLGTRYSTDGVIGGRRSDLDAGWVRSSHWMGAFVTRLGVD